MKPGTYTFVVTSASANDLTIEQVARICGASSYSYEKDELAKKDDYENTLEVISRRSEKGMLRGDLPKFCRAFRALSKHERDDLINQMLADGKISQTKTRSHKGALLIANCAKRAIEVL